MEQIMIDLQKVQTPTGQDDRPDGLGGLHEQLEITGRGNHTEGTNLQLSLFPSEVEQIERIAGGRKGLINLLPTPLFLCHKIRLTPY